MQSKKKNVVNKAARTDTVHFNHNSVDKRHSMTTARNSKRQSFFRRENNRFANCSYRGIQLFTGRAEPSITVASQWNCAQPFLSCLVGANHHLFFVGFSPALNLHRNFRAPTTQSAVRGGRVWGGEWVSNKTWWFIKTIEYYLIHVNCRYFIERITCLKRSLKFALPPCLFSSASS